jgi:hypothetical protein
VVTVNHRLGVLGYAHLADLPDARFTLVLGDTSAVVDDPLADRRLLGNDVRPVRS